jgi:signal transduction histidine kinase
MQELRQLLTVLRADDAPGASQVPVPGLEDLDSLAAEVSQSGLAVDVRVEGVPRRIPTSIGLSAYRIAQEALTNVIKHADAARASVVICYTEHDVTVEVRDDGRGTTSGSPGGGHGLIGMRERAGIHRGELTAGRAPQGGFLVRARLPLTAEDE